MFVLRYRLLFLNRASPMENTRWIGLIFDLVKGLRPVETSLGADVLSSSVGSKELARSLFSNWFESSARIVARRDVGWLDFGVQTVH